MNGLWLGSATPCRHHYGRTHPTLVEGPMPVSLSLLVLQRRRVASATALQQFILSIQAGPLQTLNASHLLGGVDTNYTDRYERSSRPDRMLVRTQRWIEHSAAIFADALDGYVRKDLYASDHRGLVVRYSRVPTDHEGKMVMEQRTWVRHPYITGSVIPQHPHTILSTNAKLSKQSPSKDSFNTKKNQTLLFSQVKQGHAIVQKLSREVYLSKVEVSFNCPEVDARFQHSLPNMALDMQFYHHDVLVVPAWKRVKTYAAGAKTLDWVATDKLDDMAVMGVRVVFLTKSEGVALCKFDLLV
eukprot:TRINITY_DN12535_c1_g1_i2.p2 TRINITY_DN12535_c1_g1~~TRINITY_DN12535_c1_g1_i2.p2  ORF type:complete len:300 (+),score=36.30 TRINITY_DN12535_c1_g1_i2:388-1287(+)